MHPASLSRIIKINRQKLFLKRVEIISIVKYETVQLCLSRGEQISALAIFILVLKSLGSSNYIYRTDNNFENKSNTTYPIN